MFTLNQNSPTVNMHKVSTLLYHDIPKTEESGRVDELVFLDGGDVLHRDNTPSLNIPSRRSIDTTMFRDDKI